MSSHLCIKKKSLVGNSWTFLSKSGRKKNVLLSKCRRFFSKSGRNIHRRPLIENIDQNNCLVEFCHLSCFEDIFIMNLLIFQLIRIKFYEISGRKARKEKNAVDAYVF